MRDLIAAIAIGILLLVSYICGIATAFMYPETCYDIVIDKDYPCTIITSKQLWKV